MKRTWPVEMYFSLISGRTVSWKNLHAGQVGDAYSMTVTGASAEPITWPIFAGSSPLFVAVPVVSPLPQATSATADTAANAVRLEMRSIIITFALRIESSWLPNR